METTHYHRPDHYYRYPMVIKSARGYWIWDTKGNKYLDLFSANGAVSCGHAHPDVNAAVQHQLDTIWTSSVLPTEVQLQLIDRLDTLYDDDLHLAQLYSTGAEAVEFGIRLARAATGRNRIIAFKGHFHGKTSGLMHLYEYYPECYGPTPPGYRHVVTTAFQSPLPDISSALSNLDWTDVAAVIFEPVVGYSGPHLLTDGFVDLVRDFSTRNKSLMIVDEIFTGLQRCSGWFYSVEQGAAPDILCFGKGLGNGLPISGVMTRTGLAASLSASTPGSTFSGNHLACAAGLAVLEVLEKPEVHENIRHLQHQFFQRFQTAEWADRGIDIDGVGAMLSLGFAEHLGLRIEDLHLECLKQHVITSFTSKRLRIIPPLTIDPEQFERGLDIIEGALNTLLATVRHP